MLNKADWEKTGHAVDMNQPEIDLVEAFRILKRQRLLFAGVLGLTILAAIGYLIVAPTRYTGHAMMEFDVHSSDGLQQPASINPAADSAYVDSQVEVLKSDAIARSVITKLKLDTDPEFTTPAHPILAAIIRFVNTVVETVVGNEGTGEPLESDRFAPLISFFQSNLTVKRTGLTYVVDVGYRSLDRQKAAKISNAIVDAYVVAELDSKYRAARQASTWLEDRVNDLEVQARKAEKVVAAYKAQNDTADTGRAPTAPELAALSAQRRAALKDIESTAQTYRMLHEAFVQKATQQQTLPSTEARLFSAAVPPIEKSDPKTLLILAAASLLGTVGGIAAAFAREHLSAVFVSPSQIQKELRTNCLAVFPTLPKLSRRQLLKGRTDGAGSPAGIEAVGHAQPGDAAARRLISRDPQGYTRAVDEPFSVWSEALRFLAADIVSMSRHISVIGIGSALAGEGKSMTAANLAELIADAGRKVLLVDCDLRNPGLTRRLAPHATRGLLDAVTAADRETTLEDLVWQDPGTGMRFLPAPLPAVHAVHPSGVLSSAPMQKLLVSAQEAYDYVILDFPPIVQVADLKAASHLIDSFILVIEWARTSQSTVLDALNTAPLLAGKLLGAVLNRADPLVLKRLESYRDRTSRSAVQNGMNAASRARGRLMEAVLGKADPTVRDRFDTSGSRRRHN